VERYKISLPWTTRLSFDFFKSRVSISEKFKCEQVMGVVK